MSIVHPTDEMIGEAALALQAGRIVAFPTETVYGLGAAAINGIAVAKVFAAKQRPRFNPLIVHVPGIAEAERHAVFSKRGRDLAEAFWPGPLTLVLPRRDDSSISTLVSAGLDSLAVRAPAHPIAQALLQAARLPIAAPSANRSGRISATSAEDVAAELGDIPDMILDGGPCPLGLESTVVRVTEEGCELLRPGALTRKAIEAVLGETLLAASMAEGAPASPGQLASHYAPSAQIRLNAAAPGPGEALLAFGSDVPSFEGALVNLSASGDLEEAAANFFAGLRALDASGAETIAVMPIPAEGLGEAINDRLTRAAAERRT